MTRYLWIVLLLSLARPGLSQDPMADTVKGLVRKMVTATTEGDYKTVLNMTHPKVLELMGGKEAAMKEVEKAMQMIKNAGLEFKVKDIGTPALARSKNDLYSVTSYGLLMTGRGKKVSMKSAIVGVSSDAGKSWKFINLDEKGEAGVREMLPEFPREMKIPAQEQKVENDG